jgi:hypothetical protein
MPDDATAVAFIARWRDSGAAERANYQLFLSELCDLLDVPRPDPSRADDTENAYVFERNVTFRHPDGSTSTGRIDLYRRHRFVLEAKQGAEKPAPAPAPVSSEGRARARAVRRGTAARGTAAWDDAMLRAYGQATQYVRALPGDEGRPPFVVVVDVGHSIELYAEFSCTGGTYVPFPDPRSHRIPLDRLADPAVREMLRLVWTEPAALDPARRSARVTREIASHLGQLAQSLEKSGHDPARVAAFLMRALFTMFAEDVGLLPKASLTRLLESLRGHPEQFVPMIGELWERMKEGGFSTALREKILCFNGNLFEDAAALPLDEDQLALILEASRADWRDVEPAIFGTLLERALDPRERHKLGAHYTPRAYVERLVFPTILEPLRAEWDAARTAAVTLGRQGKTDEARDALAAFHRRLCDLRVLDPACGTGNFLYVTLDHLKRLEAEVLDQLELLGHDTAALDLAGFTVDPHQFLGLEINPRAAAIAELVLWIGTLQWHFRTHGRVAPREPVIKAFHNIECRDAVLASDRTEPVLDEHGAPVTRWDGHTTKKHPVTGEDVPDDSARVPVLRYVNPRPAEWPAAEFIVGNPPYIGVRRLKTSIGDEYVETIRATYPDVPETSDYVMYWWEKAALAVASGATRRFGLITTNSIVQAYSRRLLERHIGEDGGVKLAFAVADHPWVDAADGAAVRVAMTVGCGAKEVFGKARLGTAGGAENDPVAFRDVERIGTSLDAVSVHEKIQPLDANAGMCFQGVVPAGDGFKLDASELVALGHTAETLPPVIRRYIIGRDLVQRPEDRFIIDFFGLTEAEARDHHPALYQRLLDRVLPERRENKRASYREKWWIFAEPRPAMRRALAGLTRFIVTPYTAKYRPFVFVSGETMPDAMAYAIASDDASILGVLSSRIHVLWALTAGGRLGVGNDPRYNSNATFFPFPFPDPTGPQRARIRELAERLDAHRKLQQGLHPKLTLTDCYNVLEKLRSGEALTAKEQATHEQGLISVLRELHDELDAAVAEAYGLAPDADDETILAHLVALNARRAAEEAGGFIRYLRPEFQAKGAAGGPASPAQTGLDLPETAPAKAATPGAVAWPKSLPEQARAVRAALARQSAPVTAQTLARSFKGARAGTVQELLDTLVSLGHAREADGERYLAA